MHCKHLTTKLTKAKKLCSFTLTLAVSFTRQELSYRKQIARQLRTQYADGSYRPKYYGGAENAGQDIAGQDNEGQEKHHA